MVTKFLEQQHIQGTDHEDKPVKEEIGYVEGGMGKKSPTEDETNKRYQNTHIGDTVVYPGGTGKVIQKTGEYITIINGDKMEHAHINETYHAGDIESHLWTKMFMDARINILNKVGIPQMLASRGWFDLPKEAKETLKKSGFAGREEGVTRKQESESYRDAINNPHVQKPVDEDADKKEKSDVEYGAYGGITTRTYLDATDEYEDDGVRATKPLSGPSGKVQVHDPVEGSKFKGADIPTINAVELEEKDGEGGEGMTTGTPGASNPVYGGDDKPKRKMKGVPEQHGTTYGMKYGITPEELQEFREKGTLRKKIFS